MMNTIKTDLANLDPSDFCNKYIFSNNAWIFDNEDHNWIGSYDNFKEVISSKLGVDKSGIHIVGSAKIGFSLSPKKDKLFRSFNNNSDLDVVIISNQLFDNIWDIFIKSYYEDSFRIIYPHSKQIFRQFFTFKNDTYYTNKNLIDASRKIDELRKNILIETGLHYRMNYRIYRTIYSAMEYHKFGITKIKQEIL